MEVRLVPVETSEEIARCAVLAEEIWREHYRTLLSEEQITYMLKMFQSETAIREQIERENYRYSLFEVDGEPVGYFGWRPDEEGAFLSKLYVRRAARRQGLARMALEEIERETGKGRIWLTVNRENSRSIAAYRRMGFEKTREQCAEIGGGFVMDDDIMERQIARGADLTR